MLNLSLTAPGNEAGYFLEPEHLKRVSDVELELLKDKDIRTVSSVPFFIRELNFLTKENREIPSSKGLINLLARYLKLIRREAPDNPSLKKLSNEDFSQITLSFNIYNSERNIGLSEDSLRALINRITPIINTQLNDLTPEQWSSEFRFLYLADLLNKGQNESTLIAVVLVFIISWITFRSIRYALLTLLPLVTGLMLNITFMALFQIPLDMLTLMVSSIVIGVGVDDAIHYNIHFRKNYRKTSDVKTAIITTHTEAGRPILHTTVSIVGGLLFLLLSNFLGITYFGLLICLALTFTMIGTLFFLPAVIAAVLSRKESSEKPAAPADLNHGLS